MAFDINDFDSLIALEDTGSDVFVGRGPSYPWGRVYGGQVVAQALRAAMLTVDDAYRAHSLHAYFIRGGDFDETIRFEVDRIRDGRSFVTRRVVAHQSVGPILNLSASFQLREDQVDVQELAMPVLAKPEDLEAENWGPILERRPVAMKGGRAACWLRVHGMESPDEAIQTCALAYASDDIPTEAASASHPRAPRPGMETGAYEDAFIGASLDHAIWFHRAGRHDEWVLHDFHSYGLVGARGFAIGQIFSRSGVHLATVTQETLMREKTR